jgi:hypothetical protein
MKMKFDEYDEKQRFYGLKRTGASTRICTLTVG